MFYLHTGERLSFAIIALSVVVLLGYSLSVGVPIDWRAFINGFIVYGVIMVVGMTVRLWGRFDRASLTLIAISFYPIFASLLALMTYQLFPLNRSLIDEHLMTIDAAFGFSWAQAVTWLADYPGVSRVLFIVYQTALPQLLVLLLILGCTGRSETLHRMLLTGKIAGLMMLAFWSLWPSFGPSAHSVLPEGVAARAQLLVTPEYGARLMDLAQNGFGVVRRHELLGTVAFPSFHVLMAVLAIWFAYRTWIFWPLVVVNGAMLPAVVTHGGHHLVDVFGGIALFVVAYAVASHLLPHQVKREQSALVMA